MNRLIVVYLCLVLPGCTSKATPTPAPFENGDPQATAPPVTEQVFGFPDPTSSTIVVRQRNGEKSFEFSLTTGPFKTLPDPFRSVQCFWGWGGLVSDPTAAEFTHEMRLKINGKPIDIPVAAFADLIDLRIGNNTLLWERGTEQIIHLEGSDAAEAYEVRFVIRGNRVVEREVWAGEMPENPHEIRKF